MGTSFTVSVDFKRGLDGEGRIEVVLSDPNAAVDMRQQGDKVVLDFLNAGVPPELARTLDVTDFATPVTQVQTRPDGNNTRMVISAHGEYEHLAYQADDLYTVEFRPLTRQEVLVNHLVQPFPRNLDRFGPVEVGQYIFRRIPKGFEKQSGGEFASAINPDIDHIFWINL